MASLAQTLSLRDRVTPQLDSVVSSLRTAVKQMESLNKVTGSQVPNQTFRDLNNSINQASVGVNQIKDSIGQLPGQQSKVTSGFSAWQKAIITANQALSLLRNTLGKLNLINWESAFNRMDIMTNFQRTMGAITGSTTVAAEALNQLNNIVLDTAYGLDTAANSVKQLVTRGMDIGAAVNQVRIWADAVAFYGQGTNDELNRVIEALGNMIVRGKVNMQQLNRISQVGINTVGIYAQVVGRTQAEIQEDLSKGTITAIEFINTVSKALDEGTNGVLKISGTAKMAATTWAATFANMRAAATRGLVAIIEAIDSALATAGLDKLMIQFTNVGKTVENVLKWIAAKIEEVAPKVELLSRSFIPLGEAFVNVANSAAKLTSTIIKSILQITDGFGGFAQSAADVLNLIADAFQWVSDNWDTLLPIITKAVLLFVAFKAVVLAWNIAMAIGGIIQGAIAVGMGIYSAAVGIATVATGGLTASQWALNTALWANPITWVIALIVLLILALIGLGLYIVYLWNTNVEFKIAFIEIWNDVLNYFDGLAVKFIAITSAIADVFGMLKVDVLTYLQDLVNEAIKTINVLIVAVSSIPGIMIEPIKAVTFGADAALKEQQAAATRRSNLSTAQAEAERRANQRAEDLANNSEQWRQSAAEREAALMGLADKIKEVGDITNIDGPASNNAANEIDWNAYDWELGSGTPSTTITGGKLDSVKDVSLSDADLKFFKDIATIDYVNYYTQSRPVVNISFGDVHETADTDKVIEVLEDLIVGKYDAAGRR